jgi:hypothetical protein
MFWYISEKLALVAFAATKTHTEATSVKSASPTYPEKDGHGTP